MPTDKRTRSRLVDAIRAELFNELGNCCTECGSTVNLQIDHPWGRTYKPSHLNFYDRWCRYRREAREGVIRLLCEPCNQAIRPWPRPAATLLPTPF